MEHALALTRIRFCVDANINWDSSSRGTHSKVERSGHVDHVDSESRNQPMLCRIFIDFIVRKVVSY